jgi:hypothetical protein
MTEARHPAGGAVGRRNTLGQREEVGGLVLVSPESPGDQGTKESSLAHQFDHIPAQALLERELCATRARFTQKPLQRLIAVTSGRRRPLNHVGPRISRN